MVESESSSGDSYMVKLDEYKILDVYGGSCTCPHFQLYLKKLVKDSGYQKIFRCKHIRAARDYCLDHVVLPAMSKADPNKNEEL